MMATDDPIDWLMAGDPAIRWQALRDLLGAPEREWKAEQRRTLEGGWGARLLALQEPNGGWGGGIYSPKWTSATYTLLTLRSIGIPRECEAAQRGARLVLDALLGAACDAEVCFIPWIIWQAEALHRSMVASPGTIMPGAQAPGLTGSPYLVLSCSAQTAISYRCPGRRLRRV